MREQALETFKETIMIAAHKPRIAGDRDVLAIDLTFNGEVFHTITTYQQEFHHAQGVRPNQTLDEVIAAAKEAGVWEQGDFDEITSIYHRTTALFWDAMFPKRTDYENMVPITVPGWVVSASENIFEVSLSGYPTVVGTIRRVQVTQEYRPASYPAWFTVSDVFTPVTNGALVSEYCQDDKHNARDPRRSAREFVVELLGHSGLETAQNPLVDVLVPHVEAFLSLGDARTGLTTVLLGAESKALAKNR